MYKNYLFDLDGTLLPLDEENFVKHYFALLGKKLASLGYNPEEMIKKLWLGTKAMILNNGKKTNEEVFWNVFHPELKNRENLKRELEKFYQEDFAEVKNSTIPSETSKKIIEELKLRKKRIILATNPIFPFVATKTRISWAGLETDNFEYITTYENSHFAKPSVHYYEEVILKNNLDPDETIMIGNDAVEDMIAMELGLKTFLVTDCLNNKNNVDITEFEQGSLDQLLKKIINKEI